jgi:ATP-dependent DNA helicase RecQ
LVQKALSAIVRTQEQIGIRMLIDILRGSGRLEVLQNHYHQLKTYGAGRDLPYPVWKEYIYQMLQLGFIEIDYVNNQQLKMTPLGEKVLYGKATATLTLYMEQKEAGQTKKKRVASKPEPIQIPENKAVDETLMDALRRLRTQIAQQEKMPAYIIFADASLQDMVYQKPLTLNAFADIRGVGDMKLEKYGEPFVQLIRSVLNV